MSPLVPTDLFRWDTLRVVGPFDLRYLQRVKGSLVEVELLERPGTWILAWRGDDRAFYFCHGLTFGGVLAPGGPISPYEANAVEEILSVSYSVVNSEADASIGDVLIWNDPITGSLKHSAILTTVKFDPIRGRLDDDSELLSKDGREPLGIEALWSLNVPYGGKYRIFRRRDNSVGGAGP